MQPATVRLHWALIMRLGNEQLGKDNEWKSKTSLTPVPQPLYSFSHFEHCVRAVPRVQAEGLNFFFCLGTFRKSGVKRVNECTPCE